MTNEIIINDKPFVSIRDAATVVTYAPDYITRLAREHKITAVQLKRRWYVHVDSLLSYIEVQDYEQSIRKKHLRRERQQERQQVQSVTSNNVRPAVALHLQGIGFAAGLLLVGGVIGLQLRDSMVDSYDATRTEAAVVVTTTAGPISRDAIQPVFETATDRAAVTNEFSIVRPEVGVGWAVIQHE